MSPRSRTVPNHQLREARLRVPSPSGSGRAMSRQELADAVNAYLAATSPSEATLDANQVGKLERGQHRWPSQARRDGFRQVLGTGTDAALGFRIIRGLPAEGPPAEADRPQPFPQPGTDAPERHTLGFPAAGAEPILVDRPGSVDNGPEVSDMKRRDLLTNLVGVSVGAAGWNPASGEALRHAVTSSVAEGDGLGLGEWDRIAWDYGTLMATTAPQDLLDDLAVDLSLAQKSVGAVRRDRDRRVIHRAMAQLCTFVAQANSDLGKARTSTRWWRTAKHLADASDDAPIRMWVRGREAINGIYDQRPPDALLNLVDEATAITSTPGLGSGSAYAARAQLLALLGRSREADAAMAQLRDVFDRLPEAVVRDTASAYGWSQTRLRHTESFVYTHLGDVARADAAQSAAVAAYSDQRSVGCAQVRLHQAICLVRQGDMTEGVRHAHRIVTELPESRRVGMVIDVAHRVVLAVPAADQHRPDVDALRHALRPVS